MEEQHERGGARSLSLQRGLSACSLHCRTRAQTAALETEVRNAPEGGRVGEDLLQQGNTEEGQGSQEVLAGAGGSDHRGWGAQSQITVRRVGWVQTALQVVLPEVWL